MDTPIRVGLVGLGYSGRTFHLPLLQASTRYRVDRVLSSQPALARKLAPGAGRSGSVSELLDSDIDLVVIAAPNTEHFSLARSSLLAGRHVVVDKPFVPDSGDGQDLIDLARERDLVLSVYQNRRWDGDFLTVQELLRDGALGDISLYESFFDRFRPEVRDRWREQSLPGSGLLYDLGAHLIDQALVLFGDPASITAQVLQQRRGARADDYFQLVLDYSPLQVILGASMLATRPRCRFNVQGTAGTYIKRGVDPQERRLAAGDSPGDERWGAEDPSEYGSIVGENGSTDVQPTAAGNYSIYYEQLADCLANKAPNPVPPQQALKVIEIIELAHRSHATGRRIAFR